jgi:hypothetical protein
VNRVNETSKDTDSTAQQGDDLAISERSASVHKPRGAKILSAKTKGFWTVQVGGDLEPPLVQQGPVMTGSAYSLDSYFAWFSYATNRKTCPWYGLASSDLASDEVQI